MRSLTLLLLVIASVPLRAGDSALPAIARRFLATFDRLRAAESIASTSRPRVEVAMSEGEINEYLQYSLRATPRPGIESVHIQVFPNNYISTFTVVDFDAIERWKPGTIPPFLRPVLRGRQSVWVDYRFGTTDAKLTFLVEKAYFDKVRLPSFLVRKMIAIVAARQPEQYDTAKPLPLPFALKAVWTDGGTLKAIN